MDYSKLVLTIDTNDDNAEATVTRMWEKVEPKDPKEPVSVHDVMLSCVFSVCVTDLDSNRCAGDSFQMTWACSQTVTKTIEEH